jgi:hypothetical protein
MEDPSKRRKKSYDYLKKGHPREDEGELNMEVMHVRCIHDLCTLPLDIPPYLHHILVIFMLFDDYWE